MRLFRTRGLTLIELLLAMSIFTLLGVFLFTLVGRSLELYRAAEGSGELIDGFDATLTPLADDLACVFVGDPAGPGKKVQFLLTHDRRYVPSPESATSNAQQIPVFALGDPRALLLRFVRTFPGGELESTLGRFAGTYKDAGAYIDGVDDLVESRAIELTRRGDAPAGAKTAAAASQTPAAGLLSPGGLMEVMYFLASGAADAPGTCTLYRAVRAPIGGAGSFFAEDMPDTMTPEWIAAHATPVMSNVLYFGILCWSQSTQSWETERSLDGEGVRAGADDTSWPGAELFWDSTRGRISQFGLARGAASLAHFEDDVFPVRVQIVLTLAPDGGASQGLVVGDTPVASRFVRVTNPKPFAPAGDERPYVRVGDEWLRVTSVDGPTLTVDRGMRASEPQVHRGGTEYRSGRTITKVIEIPAHRSYFRGPGEER
jgi:prepilin-type N-terminal cleavage/methylation domain-containing protein